MNRRNTIENLTALGALAVLPVTTITSITEKLPFHFIGLGGEGTNIMEHFLKKGAVGHFTYINCTERHALKDAGVQFIHLAASTRNNFGTSYQDSVDEFAFPAGWLQFCKGNNRIVLFAGMGGFTGTRLMEKLWNELPKDRLQAICTLPFGFEGPQRQQVAKIFYTKHKGKPNMRFFDMDAFGKANGKIKMKDAFEKCHDQLYDIFNTG